MGLLHNYRYSLEVDQLALSYNWNNALCWKELWHKLSSSVKPRMGIFNFTTYNFLLKYVCYCVPEKETGKASIKSDNSILCILLMRSCSFPVCVEIQLKAKWPRSICCTWDPRKPVTLPLLLYDANDEHRFGDSFIAFVRSCKLWCCFFLNFLHNCSQFCGRIVIV